MKIEFRARPCEESTTWLDKGACQVPEGAEMSALDELLHKNLKDMSHLEFVVWNYYDKYDSEHPLGADKAAEELAQLRNRIKELEKYECQVIKELCQQLKECEEGYPQWQPIETCPENMNDDDFLFLSYGDVIESGCKYDDGRIYDSMCLKELHPTYWMPLPELPKEQK